MTQSRVSDTESLESTAEALTSALADQPGGVFVDFAAAGERADRSAVTYREVRADRSVDWTVLLDGGVRIAIGCQGPVDGPGPEAACDRAIRSAHAVDAKVIHGQGNRMRGWCVQPCIRPQTGKGICDDAVAH